MLCAFAASLWFACSSDSEEREVVLDIPIDGNNDSLLDFDTLIVQVISQDSSFVQEVFHGRLRDPRKLMGLVLDPRMGRQFTVRIFGYKGGKLGMRREYAIEDLKPTVVVDLPVSDTSRGTPLVEITSPAGDTAVNTSPFTLQYRLNGVLFQKTLPLVEGPNRLGIDTSIGGRRAFDSVTVTLDRTPPGRPILTGRTPVNALRPTWTWRSGGNGGMGRYRYTLDDEDLGKGQLLQDTSFTPATDLAPGPRILFLQERDLAGNWSEAARFPIFIDVTPPAAPVAGAGMPGVTVSRRPTWSWAGGGGGMGLFRFKLGDEEMKVDATTAARTTFVPGSDLGDGPHTLYVQEGDSAGNWSPITPLTLRIDLTPPSAPAFDSTPYSPVASLRPTWTWKSGGGGGYGVDRLKLGDSDLEEGADTVTQRSFKPGSDLPEGRHTLWIQERDSVGNWSAAASRSLVVTTRGRVGDGPISEGGTSVYNAAIAIGQNGAIYSAYQDYGNGGSFGKFVMKKYSGATWQEIGNPQSKAILWWPNAFALTPTGVPHVVVGDSLENGRILRYDGEWNNLGVEPAFPSGMGEPALAFTKTSVPYVAFRDRGKWESDRDQIE